MRLLRFLAALILVAMGWLTLTYWPEFPAPPPELAGRTTLGRGKGMLLLLPLLGLATYGMLALAARFSDQFGVVVPITPENARRQRSLVRVLAARLQFQTALLYAVIQWKLISTSILGKEGLGVALIPVLLMVLVGTIAIYLIQSYRAR